MGSAPNRLDFVASFRADVDRPPYRGGCGRLSGLVEARCVISGRAHIGPSVCLPGDRLVDQSAVVLAGLLN